LKFRGGNTSFGPPLMDAMKIMEKYDSTCDAFIIMLYTDGEAKYPKEEILKLKDLKINFKFYGLCEGLATKDFSKMTIDLGGQVSP
jgi:hypothetical protein